MHFCQYNLKYNSAFYTIHCIGQFYDTVPENKCYNRLKKSDNHTMHNASTPLDPEVFCK